MAAVLILAAGIIIGVIIGNSGKKESTDVSQNNPGTTVTDKTAATTSIPDNGGSVTQVPDTGDIVTWNVKVTAVD